MDNLESQKERQIQNSNIKLFSSLDIGKRVRLTFFFYSLFPFLFAHMLPFLLTRGEARLTKQKEQSNFPTKGENLHSNSSSFFFLGLSNLKKESALSLPFHLSDFLKRVWSKFSAPPKTHTRISHIWSDNKNTGKEREKKRGVGSAFILPLLFYTLLAPSTVRPCPGVRRRRL